MRAQAPGTWRTWRQVRRWPPATASSSSLSERACTDARCRVEVGQLWAQALRARGQHCWWARCAPEADTAGGRALESVSVEACFEARRSRHVTHAQAASRPLSVYLRCSAPRSSPFSLPLSRDQRRTFAQSPPSALRLAPYAAAAPRGSCPQLTRAPARQMSSDSGRNREMEQAFAQALASVQLQAQREMAERMISTCFERCVPAPDARLTDKQRRCLDMCAGSFMEGYQLAVRGRELRGCCFAGMSRGDPLMRAA